MGLQTWFVFLARVRYRQGTCLGHEKGVSSQGKDWTRYSVSQGRCVIIFAAEFLSGGEMRHGKAREKDD